MHINYYGRKIIFMLPAMGKKIPDGNNKQGDDEHKNGNAVDAMHVFHPS